MEGEGKGGEGEEGGGNVEFHHLLLSNLTTAYNSISGTSLVGEG